MSTQFLTDPKIEDLGEKHGPGGPLVIVALLGRAKIADDAGRVTCSYRTLGNEAFVGREEARAIVADAASSGLIELDKTSNSEASLCFPAFKRWQEAGRKAKEREDRKATSQANVLIRPGVSGPVPTDRQTRQTDKTGQTDRHAGALVTDDESKLAFSIITAFATLSHQRFNPDNWLDQVVPCLRAFPELTEAEHLKIIRANLADPWWSGPPTPAVLYSQVSTFERAVAAWRGGGPKKTSGMDQAERFAEMARQAEAEERNVA